MVNDKLFGGVFRNRSVLVTGHTGFKGSWLTILLHYLGAKVSGFALKPHTNPSLYELADIEEIVDSTYGDIRDYNLVLEAVKEYKPEFIIHMAAQSLVKESYKNPVGTYEVNVIGTANVFEAARHSGTVKVILNVTTDKCYENKEWLWGYRENDVLGGYDPYSNSKACSELVTSSYRDSFFNPKNYSEHAVAIATARAGNVIGGGDWADDRLIPDFIRAIISGEKVKIRNPLAIRPWQHVLEPLSGYLTLTEKLYREGINFAESWNFGPLESDARNVEWITKRICSLWGTDAAYEIDKTNHPHEAGYLKLDCAKARTRLKWNPKWNIEIALEKIIEWTKEYVNKADIKQVCLNQIREYFE